jgi:hypothetical protein
MSEESREDSIIPVKKHHLRNNDRHMKRSMLRFDVIVEAHIDQFSQGFWALFPSNSDPEGLRIIRGQPWLAQV